MKYATNLISKQDLLKELNAKFGNGDWDDMLNEATYSLVANVNDYKKYPQYYDFENINGNHYVIEIRNEEIFNIYRIDETSDYEYSCQEIFWQTAHEWTDDVEKVGHELYLID